MRMIDADMLADGLKLHRQSTDQKHETDRQWAVGYNAGPVSYTHLIAENSRERAEALAADLERLIGTEIDDNFRLDIARLMQAGMQEAVIMEAARQTGNKHLRKPAAYLRTILQGYERDGVLTAADLEATQGKACLLYTSQCISRAKA